MIDIDTELPIAGTLFRPLIFTQFFICVTPSHFNSYKNKTGIDAFVLISVFH